LSKKCSGAKGQLTAWTLWALFCGRIPGASPDEWQADFLKELGEEVRKRNFNGTTPVLPIRFTTSSGHGIGKSVFSRFDCGLDYVHAAAPTRHGDCEHLSAIEHAFQQSESPAKKPAMLP